MPTNININDAIAALRGAMAEFGIICGDTIISDGKFHHFVPEGGKKKSGWYILNDYSYGAFGDFAKGIRQKWQYRSNLDMIFSEALEQEKAIQHSKLKLEVDNRAKHERASIKANKIFESLAAKGESTYLNKKHVIGHGIRYGKNYIAIPLAVKLEHTHAPPRQSEECELRSHKTAFRRGLNAPELTSPALNQSLIAYSCVINRYFIRFHYLSITVVNKCNEKW